MDIRRFGSMRKVFGGLLAGTALAVLSGCYPYYYDGHGHGYYKQGYQSQRHHYDGGYYYHRDRGKRYKRYRHHRRGRYKHY